MKAQTTDTALSSSSESGPPARHRERDTKRFRSIPMDPQ